MMGEYRSRKALEAIIADTEQTIGQDVFFVLHTLDLDYPWIYPSLVEELIHLKSKNILRPEHRIIASAMIRAVAYFIQEFEQGILDAVQDEKKIAAKSNPYAQNYGKVIDFLRFETRQRILDLDDDGEDFLSIKSEIYEQLRLYLNDLLESFDYSYTPSKQSQPLLHHKEPAQRHFFPFMEMFRRMKAKFGRRSSE